MEKIKARQTAKPTRREWNCSSGALFSHPGLVGNRSHQNGCQ